MGYRGSEKPKPDELPNEMIDSAGNIALYEGEAKTENDSWIVAKSGSYVETEKMS